MHVTSDQRLARYDFANYFSYRDGRKVSLKSRRLGYIANSALSTV